jgi:hypothetical protein
MSFFRRFPDGCVLVGLTTEELAHLLLPYFRSLPASSRNSAAACAAKQAALYPKDLRRELLNAMIAAWDFLHDQGLLLDLDEPTLARTVRRTTAPEETWNIAIVARRIE